jgi:hypothetical protein
LVDIDMTAGLTNYRVYVISGSGHGCRDYHCGRACWCAGSGKVKLCVYNMTS